MKRLSTNEKNKLFRLIKGGYSLNKICKSMNLKKTTSYYYVRKIRGKKIKPVTINYSNKEKIGEFVGIFAGDGSYFYDKKVHKHSIRITFNSKEKTIAKYYADVIEQLAKKPSIYYYKNIVIVNVTSKEIVNFLKKFLFWVDGKKTYTICLNDEIKHFPNEFLIGFLRGLIDSDGYVRNGRDEIYFGSVSKKLVLNFTNTLDLLKFKYKVYKQIRKDRTKIFYKVRITNEEVGKFCSFIKPLKYIHGSVVQLG